MCQVTLQILGYSSEQFGQKSLLHWQSYSIVKWSEEVAQSCLTVCDPMDCSLQGSSVHGIFQARVLEWVAISFSRGSSRLRDQTQVSHIAGRWFAVWAPEKPILCARKCITVMWKHLACVRVALSGFSAVQLFATLWTVPCQTPLSTGLSRQEHWNGLPCPPPGEPSQPRDPTPVS